MKLDESWQRYFGGKYPHLVARYDAMVALVKPPSVLDIGCGQGLLGFLLCVGRTEITKNVGVDISEMILRDGRRCMGSCRAKVELKRADAYDLPFEDESFTTVVLCEILEHLNMPGLVILEALRVLAPEGRLITSVPADEVRRSKAHCMVFSNVGQLQDLFANRIKWRGAERLFRWYFAWGDKR